MLNIYYGRESIDKEKFIYESIGKTENTLVLVPDQYTLEAEKEAFHILGGECLMNMEILSISRLGSRILKGQGSAGKTFIDKYGRHMLLSHIMGELESSLQVFRGVSRKNSFIEMVNNFISEMKQYNVSPEALAQIETSSGDGILAMKLKDLRLIFEKYEEKIKDNYTDTEDYIELYKDKIGETDFIKNSTVWIYGFDSFAPKAVSVIGQLMVYARNVNVVLTYDENCLDEDIFTLSAIVMKKLEEEACALGIDHRRTQIDDSFLLKKNNFALETVEKQLFAITKSPCSNTEGLTLVESANPYNEAESAASYILHLVRDKGLRYRDIVVICGDIEKRASIINRVFAEYGLDMFDDRKRSVLNSPIAIYVVALLE
ncbi:MAG: exodeoxyribonuclease V subunit gamma, partial [Eubacteriaceae bacterium]|nr:exodeoxyribonuclease V subunit gamma [Eubacteriaceae bacterium]